MKKRGRSLGGNKMNAWSYWEQVLMFVVLGDLNVMVGDEPVSGITWKYRSLSL